MEHILDNHIWNALQSNNRHMALGTHTVGYFRQDVAPFAGIRSYNTDTLQELWNDTPADRVRVLFSSVALPLSDDWEIKQQMKALQMVYAGVPTLSSHPEEVQPLSDEHIPEMLALTQLTNPGPFLPRTIEFGNYEGIFCEGRLAAMAGQRMRPFEYTEISAVCTHPDFLGRGYAAKLLNSQIRQITALSSIPFLHVKSDNERAVKLYERSGFVTRKEFLITVITKR